MSTTQHTGHYNLPTFGDNPNDRPSWRGDFTDAMTTIDNQMYANATNITTATAAANNANTAAGKAKQAADYDTTFLKGMDIPARYGKPVYVRREYHERIAKISMMLTGGKVSLSAYIDNVLAQHFEQYREEIEAAYAGKMEKLF